MLKEAFKYGVIFIFSTLSLSQGLASNIRDNIEDRRYLRCGIEERPDFLGVKNPLNAMAISLCEALTLVIFKDPKALKLVSIPTGKSDDFLDNRFVDLVMLGDEYEITKQ